MTQNTKLLHNYRGMLIKSLTQTHTHLPVLVRETVALVQHFKKSVSCSSLL